MEIWIALVIFVGGVVTGVLSGMSGGGGGMLMIPLMIALGLSPQQAVATGKMGGLGAAFGGLSVFFKSGHIRRDILKVMMPIAIAIGITAPIIFIKLDSQIMQRIIGFILITMVPTLFIKKKGLTAKSKKQRGLGYAAYSGVLALQALFGTGVGALALFVLTLLLGTTKLEANATKRAVTAVLTPVTFFGLLVAGFVHVAYGLCGLVGAFIGTHIGSRIAVRKGEQFVTISMAIIVTFSGLALLLS